MRDAVMPNLSETSRFAWWPCTMIPSTIGLSQVRETAVFSGIPITEQKIERQSGVWVVDLRSGRTVGFLRFSEQVQEIFAVQVLQGIRFPEIVADEDRLAGAFVLPDDALRQVPADLRAK